MVEIVLVKERTMSPKKPLPHIFWATLLLCAVSTSAYGQNGTAETTPLKLRELIFDFPGDGERNENRTIGDFCCTGETATIRTDEKAPVGYIYFYSFKGGMNCEVDGGIHSSAREFEVLVSGISDATRLDSKRVKSSIRFCGCEMEPGTAHRTIAGVLQFTATILDVQFTNKTHSSYWMDSVRVRVEVRQLSDEEVSRMRSEERENTHDPR
jgi:hypothetical protein